MGGGGDRPGFAASLFSLGQACFLVSCTTRGRTNLIAIHNDEVSALTSSLVETHQFNSSMSFTFFINDHILESPTAPKEHRFSSRFF